MSNDINLMPPIEDGSSDLGALLQRREPKPRSKVTAALVGALVLLVGVLIGVMLGRGSGSTPATPTMSFGPGATGQQTQPSAQDGGATAPNPGAVGFGGRGTMGTVVENANGELVIETDEGQITVVTSGATQVTKSQDVEVSSLTAGETVTVLGAEGEDGSIEAQRIIVGEAGFGPGGGFRP